MAFTRLEDHLAFLYNSPPVIQRVFHLVIGTGLLGFFIKLYKPSESNLLFDGASLCLYMIAIIIYATNTIKGMQVVNEGRPDAATAAAKKAMEGKGEWDTGLGATPGLEGSEAWGPETLGWEDGLKVMSASNTILALILTGVLVLQAGQWYAERKQRQEEEEIAKERAEKAKSGSGGGGGGGGSSSVRDHKSPSAAAKKKV